MTITSYIPTIEEYKKWYSGAGLEDMERMIEQSEQIIDSFSADLLMERNKLLAIKELLRTKK